MSLVTDVGTIDDQSLNQSAWEAVQQAEKELGARIEFIETADAKDYGRNISIFGDQNFDVIVTVGYALSNATVAAATTYPETDFIGVDQFQAETVNGFAGINFAEDQAGFLVGAMAALMSKSNTIGAVCGNEAVPAAWRFGEGYKAGAAFADQFKGLTTNVLVVYQIGAGLNQTISDPEWGAATARDLVDQGADVIFSCGGITGNAAVTAAAMAGVYAIGADTDQYLTLPEAAPRLLSSALKLTTPSVFELIKLSKEGQFPSGNYAGKIGYAPFHDLEQDVPESVKQMMEQIKTGLLDGSIQTHILSSSP